MNWAQSGATSITFCRSHESVRSESATSGFFLDIGLPLVCNSFLPAKRRCGPVSAAVNLSDNNHHICHSRNMLLGMPRGVKGGFSISQHAAVRVGRQNPIKQLTRPFVRRVRAGQGGEMAAKPPSAVASVLYVPVRRVLNLLAFSHVRVSAVVHDPAVSRSGRARSHRRPASSRQAHRRLSPNEVEELVASYLAGATAFQLGSTHRIQSDDSSDPPRAPRSDEAWARHDSRSRRASGGPVRRWRVPANPSGVSSRSIQRPSARLFSRSAWPCAPLGGPERHRVPIPLDRRYPMV